VLLPARFGVASEPLPQALAQRIERAAPAGRATEAAIWDPHGARAALGNRLLNAAVIEAIAEHPPLAGALMAAAIAADPAALPALREAVRAAFPGVVGRLDLADAALAPGGFEATEVELLAAEDGRDELPPYPPLAGRPEDWPILPEEGGPDRYAEIDPLEPINIAIFYFNGALDYILFEPITKTYAAIMPDEAEEALGRAFDNLGAPITFINDLLQLEFENAGITLARFLLNSTIGVGGLIDVAEKAGLPAHKADFGQTLHRYGVGDGIYIVLPLFGPTTLRDAVGFGVDFALDPRRYVFEDEVGLGLALGEGIVRRGQVIGPADFIEAYADDPYDAVRAWTYQKRELFLSRGCDQPSMIICVGDFSK
jgi:ABC-type transporter lipoprotein component MlaA